jgi:uncharacterized protein YggE
MKSAATIATGIVLGALGVTLVGRVVGPLPFSVTQTTTNKQSTFDVQGQSKVTTAPDKAVVSMGITVNESTVKQAQDKANTIINTIISELGKLGIDKKDIKTENYSLYPNSDFNGGRQTIVGYSVNASLSVSITDFAKLNQAIDTATRVGANQIGGINFTLSDDKKKEVETQARKEAIDDAKSKATELSKLAGMRLGKIINVMELPVFDVPRYAMTTMMEAGKGGGGGAPTAVEPGSTTYQYTVTLSYETL